MRDENGFRNTICTAVSNECNTVTVCLPITTMYKEPWILEYSLLDPSEILEIAIFDFRHNWIMGAAQVTQIVRACW